MSQNNRHKKSNDKDSSAEQYTDSVDDSLTQENITINSVTRAANSEVNKGGSDDEGDKSKLAFFDFKYFE